MALLVSPRRCLDAARATRTTPSTSRPTWWQYGRRARCSFVDTPVSLGGLNQALEQPWRAISPAGGGGGGIRLGVLTRAGVLRAGWRFAGNAAGTLLQLPVTGEGASARDFCAARLAASAAFYDPGFGPTLTADGALCCSGRASPFRSRVQPLAPASRCRRGSISQMLRPSEQALGAVLAEFGKPFGPA